MTFGEFRELFGCTVVMFIAVFTVDRHKLRVVNDEVEAIHARIDARKATHDRT